MDPLKAFSSADEMNDVFLEGIVCSHPVFVNISRMPEAGLGLYSRDEVPAGTEIFRAMPVVSAV